MALTGNTIENMLRAAGASPTGLVASPDKIADLFTEAVLKYGDGLFTTSTRVAALLSECMVESAWYRTTQEYSNPYMHAYAPYVGRGFIQCTHKDNYRSFGKWCKAKGLLSDSDYFVDNPGRLADLKWAALTGVWYFTHVRFSGKPLVEYAGNIRQVGRAVNNGNPFTSYPARNESERIRAYNAVKSLGKSVVPTPPPDQVPDAPGTENKIITTKIDIHPTKGSIHTPYGARGPYWSYDRRNGQGMHTGDDWHDGPSSAGNPIYAVANGRVIHQGHARGDSPGWGKAFGNHVLIEWDDHRIGGTKRVSIDAHMTRNVVDYNQRVEAGDLIGYLGATGNVTGPHDHHEQHAGQGWGDRRLKPIYPGKTITKIVPEEAPVKYLKNVNGRGQKLGRGWEWLRVGDNGGIATIRDRVDVVNCEVYLIIGGLKPNESVHLFWANYDIRKKKNGKNQTRRRVSNHANYVKIAGDPSGWVRVSVPLSWAVYDPQKGWDFQSLMFRVRTTSKSGKVQILRTATTAYLQEK